MYNNIINLIENATGLRVKLFHTKEIEPCIVYDVSPVSNNGISAIDNLQIRIIHNSARECVEAEEKINKILLTCGDRIGGEFTSARVNGGGFMPQDETNTVHKYTFYLIKRKAV